jgi:large subunit ribosomal protein L29
MLTKPSQIRELAREEVQQRLETLHQELFNLRFRKGTKQGLTNPLRLRTLRREIARIQTILGEDVRGEKRLATSEKR